MYDKCWQLDITWAEVEALLDGEVVESTSVSGSIKHVRLLEGWLRPLHLVEVVDHENHVTIYVTIYEPDLGHWEPGFRRRRPR